MNSRIALILGLCCSAAPAQTNHVFGLLRAPEQAYLNYPIAGVPPTGVLPPQASLEQFLPPPGNQGAQGSCTAWATTFALRTALQVRFNSAWNPPDTVARQFSPAFVFNSAKAATAAPDCSGGILFSTALNILQNVGALTLDTFPYDAARCDAKPTATQNQQAHKYLIASWERAADLSLNRFKAYIASGDPVLAGIDIHPSFDQAQGTATITGASGAWLGYHAILLIGYDDSKSAFRIQNSWGPDWADQGRAWVDYDTLSAILHEAYIVNPLLPPSAFDLSTITAAARRFGIVNDSSQPDSKDRLNQIFQSMDTGFPKPAANNQNFAIRVNAFESRDLALALARSIEQGSSGLEARIIRQQQNGKTVYDVLVAAGVDSDEAALVLARARNVGFRQAAAITLK